jgi:cob(I)alamin adenosyltransferase
MSTSAGIFKRGQAMVRIDRVVTRGGDGGETSLGDGARVPKDDARVEAYGTVDEANAAIGVLRLYTGEDAAVEAMLAAAQNDLFDIGADLCVPGEAGDRLRVTAAVAARLEQAVFTINESLPPLTSFVLPGGSAGSAHAHLARTIVRRAERLVVSLARRDAVNPEVVRALNRLSDLLFVIGRRLNGGGAGDVLWRPGANE